MLLSCFQQSIKALVLGSVLVLPIWWRQKEVLKEGFQKRCDSSLLFSIKVRFHSFKERPLPVVAALVLTSLVKTGLQLISDWKTSFEKNPVLFSALASKLNTGRRRANA